MAPQESPVAARPSSTPTWGAFNTAVSAANLPSDTDDAWKALIRVPELLPFGLAAPSLSVLVWSLLPAKRTEPTVDAAQPVEDEAERIYRVKRAEADASRPLNLRIIQRLSPSPIS
jgi:hypothetical protein